MTVKRGRSTRGIALGCEIEDHLDVKLFTALLLATSLFAADSYSKNDGPVTVYAMDWNPAASVPSWITPSGPAPFGLWVSACSESKPPLRAVITSVSGDAETVQVFKFSAPSGKCASLMAPGIKRASVTSLLIVTDGVEVTDIAR